MFGRRFFGAGYFGPRYWGDGGSIVPPEVIDNHGVVTMIRDEVEIKTISAEQTIYSPRVP